MMHFLIINLQCLILNVSLPLTISSSGYTHTLLTWDYQRFYGDSYYISCLKPTNTPDGALLSAVALEMGSKNVLKYV